jgi:hypothetical protein
MKKTHPLRSETAYPVIARYFKSGLRPNEFYKKKSWSDNQFSYRKSVIWKITICKSRTMARSRNFIL